MDRSVAIKIENLSKQYRLGVIGTGTLSHDLKRWWTVNVRGKEDPYLKIGEVNDPSLKGKEEYVWALKDINLEIEQGDVIGIIGKNGAGKSTLLKILSRVTKPTTGKIHYKGRIASLLEVGTGFHPEMTGRENIYMNGAIMGMSRAEITRKLDEIVAFAGVERFIDTPVKRYSSGMTVRLGFSIAAHLEPDILVVDEVLAVGDAEFQKKAIGKMQDVSKGQGRTVLFVSHNMAAVQNLCTSSMLLVNGKIRSIGNTSDIIQEYLTGLQNIKKWQGNIETDILNVYNTYVKNSKNEDQFLCSSDEIEIGIELEIKKEISDLVCGINIISGFGYPILRANYNDFNLCNKLNVGKYLLKYKIPPNFLAVGNYIIDFDIAIPFVVRLIGGQVNLSFEIISNSAVGNKYTLEGSAFYNSIVRPDIFVNETIKPIKNKNGRL